MIALLATVCAMAAITVFAVIFDMPTPVVKIQADGFTVKSRIYGADVPFGDVVDLQLTDRLPRILLRTNGYAAGGKLRGNFKVADLGRGKIFIDRKQPPFIIVKTTKSFVILNLENRAKTEAMFQRLSERWPATRP